MPIPKTLRGSDWALQNLLDLQDPNNLHELHAAHMCVKNLAEIAVRPIQYQYSSKTGMFECRKVPASLIMADHITWLRDLIDSAPPDMPGEPLPWHVGVFDAHCHPTDTPSCIDSVPQMKARGLTIMATRGEDQEIVARFAERLGVTRSSISQFKNTHADSDTHSQVVPSFGWHPWFSHQIFIDAGFGPGNTFSAADKISHYKSVISPPPEDDDFLTALPDPRPLSGLLEQIKKSLQQYPYALVGEIGLDRSFRLPENWLPNVHTERHPDMTPGGREGRRLSHFKVNIDHQRSILEAQLRLAGEMQRAVSVHGVAAHGILFETIKETWRGYEKEVLSKRERKQRENTIKAHAEDDEGSDGSSQPGPSTTSLPYPPRICLHSYSGPPDTLRDYFHPSVPAEIFCSFSLLVNLKSSTATKTVNVIKAVPDDRVLVESDLHCAGDQMDELLDRMIRCVCKAKSWSLEQGVERLRSNWLHFVFGQEADATNQST